MSKYLTLHVENFAKIRKATIEAAPLTLLVGDNNSGKSYLLSLLWGLTGGVDFRYLLSDEQRSAINFDKIQNLLDFWRTRDYGETIEGNGIPPHKKPLPVNAEEQSILTEGINFLLAEIKNDLVRDILNTDEIAVQSIHLDIPFREDLEVGYQIYNGIGFIPWHLTVQDASSGFIEGSVPDFLCNFVDVSISLARSVFIPAPRTGFLLTIKTLTQKSLRTTFGREPLAGNILTSPQVAYLEKIAAPQQRDLEKMKLAIRGILDYVERDIICGEIKITKTPLPEILYKPKGLDQTLPLYLTSGVVTEVAGFLSLLKFGHFGRICIYEEPEMCLHPELQWKMARVLVKLVNAGFSVWASTHSDIIIQHVNNMIKLSNHSNREQLRLDHNYDEDDVVSPEKVRMYQFDVNPSDHKTDVKLLECGDNGFRIPTFGKVFRELRDEVWSLHIDKEET